MKGFLKELQESNATGAVQVVKTLSGSVKQPELDSYADKEIFSVHGNGKAALGGGFRSFHEPAFAERHTDEDTALHRWEAAGEY